MDMVDPAKFLRTNFLSTDLTVNRKRLGLIVRLSQGIASILTVIYL